MCDTGAFVPKFFLSLLGQGDKGKQREEEKRENALWKKESLFFNSDFLGSGF